MNIDLAFGEQELDALTGSAVHDGLVFSFFIITEIVEGG